MSLNQGPIESMYVSLGPVERLLILGMGALLLAVLWFINRSERKPRLNGSGGERCSVTWV
jgi:hypothetical protein